MISSLHALLEARARSYPERPAILGLDRPPLTYAGLYEHVIRTAAALRRSGVGRNHRVALVMPNGPGMATAFLSAAVVGTCAPLNPAYRAGEFDFYLSDLDAKALLVDAGSASPAVGAARSRGIPVIEIQPVESAPAGVFAAEDETALVLHTSGTTSRPKIVPLTHTNLCTSARNVAASLALTEEDRCLNVMPLFHIHGLVASLLASLWAGASVVCTPGFDAPRFFDWMATAEPTWYTAVPTMHQSILAQAARTARPKPRHPLRLIRSSSAALPPQVMTRLEDVFRAPVIEAYGMTEAAHQIASNPLPPARRIAGTVGLAAGPEVAIIDGEVVLRGPNVTRGYETNPEANVAAFVDGWFRTGDLGTIDDEGYLTLTGRLKEIINRGGEKISPREVEEAIMDHPAVEQVVVFAAPDHSLGESVAAAIVLRDGLTPTATEIRKFAVARLTDFKVPATILFVEEIPKGPTGKLQRIGLAEKLGLGSGAGTAPAKPHIEPQSALDKLIASIWAEVLRVEQVGLEDDFLALGGDSMLATQVISRIRDKLELEITVASFFDASTVKDQAGIIEELLPAARIRRRGGSGPAELSTAQKRIWLLHQFDPASPISNRPMALRLTGTLDRDALAQALNEIARRHEILRTVFPAEEGEARQVVLPAAAIPFETQDIRETAGETREKAAQRIASAEAIRPFDLANGPLARVKLLQLGSADHVLLILMHHIVFDGWSENVFVNELKQLYRAFALHQASPLPAPPIQYADFAAWQQRRLMDGAIDGQVEYWRKQLAGAPSALNLPADFNAPAHPRWRGEARTLLLNSSVTEGLKRASREERVSLFMTLLATLQLLLARYADQEDIVIGVPVAGRNRVETEDLIGCFMNVLVLRTKVDAGLTVRQLLGRVRDAALGAFANQEVPFEKLVEEVRPERLPDRWPLFQTMFQLRNLPKRDSVEVEGLRFEPFEFDAGVIGGLDLSVEIREAPQGLRCSFRYDASLYGGETIERMMGHFENLLDGIVRARDQRVSKLPLLGDAERRRVLVDWNDTRAAFPQDTCIHHLFEAQAERAPEAIAVESEQGRLTYRDLNRRANQVARHLRGLGARPETIVAISMERSPELLAGLLGILKSGAAYLPLDPAHPKERLAYLVRDAGATMLLTQRPLLERLPKVDCALYY